jgi:hypothetical protein
VASASHSYRDWDFWFHGTDVAFETSPKVDDAFGFTGNLLAFGCSSLCLNKAISKFFCIPFISWHIAQAALQF